MAVYEQTYRPYAGALTPAWSRFLVLPRFAAARIFASRAFMMFAAVCLVAPTISALLIYLHHNLTALGMLNLSPALLAQQLPINERFFMGLLAFQSWLAFLLALFVGPALIAPDLAQNGLALYLCRPFSRWEYLLGKFSLLAGLMSLATWVPILLLFALQSALAGWEWFSGHLRLGAAIALSAGLWILLVSLMVLAASAWVRRKPLAAALVLAFFFVSRGMAGMITLVYGTSWGGLLDLWGLNRSVWLGFAGLPSAGPIPAGLAAVAILGFCGLFLALLMRKLRAYHVVR